ncbi:MAG TPA: hypothetical protein VKT72_14545 [Candidatus Baltobacteraceae bacterium]|nr:hypothetical protein [Candidatus Baltobacteraceae bacterium]
MALAVVFAGGFSAILIEPHFNLEHALFPSVISSELRTVPNSGSPEMRVLLWLRQHRDAIALAATRFHVSRVAIAGAIAYEALLNVHFSDYDGLALWSGPGKVHYKEYRLSQGDPVAKQVEDLGLLPKRNMEQRRALLEDPSWAALYIAAIMSALAKVATQETRHNPSCEPGALVSMFVSLDLPEARQYFSRSSEEKSFIVAYGLPGNWTIAHSKVLSAAVGGSRCETLGDASRVRVTRPVRRRLTFAVVKQRHQVGTYGAHDNNVLELLRVASENGSPQSDIAGAATRLLSSQAHVIDAAGKLYTADGPVVAGGSKAHQDIFVEDNGSADEVAPLKSYPVQTSAGRRPDDAFS